MTLPRLAKSRVLSLSLFATVAISLRTDAATLWDNGGPNLTNPVYLYTSDFNFFQGSMAPRGSQAGDDFFLSANATARQVQWWGAYAPAGFAIPPDLFTIRFFTFIGSPAVVPLFSYTLVVQRIDTGMTIGSYELYRYTALIPDTFLTSGHYLFSVVNDTTGNPSDWGWAASTQFGNGMSFARVYDGQTWDGLNVEFAFKITDSAVLDVPDEGQSVFLLAIGLAGLFLVRGAALSRPSTIEGS